MIEYQGKAALVTGAGSGIGRALVGAGESASLVRSIQPAAEIVAETVTVFWREMERLAGLLKRAPAQASPEQTCREPHG